MKGNQPIEQPPHEGAFFDGWLTTPTKLMRAERAALLVFEEGSWQVLATYNLGAKRRLILEKLEGMRPEEAQAIEAALATALGARQAALLVDPRLEEPVIAIYADRVLSWGRFTDRERKRFESILPALARRTLVEIRAWKQRVKNQQERERIEAALESSGLDMAKAAKLLRMSPARLRARIAELRLRTPIERLLKEKS